MSQGTIILLCITDNTLQQPWLLEKYANKVASIQMWFKTSNPVFQVFKLHVYTLTSWTLLGIYGFRLLRAVITAQQTNHILDKTPNVQCWNQ